MDLHGGKLMEGERFSEGGEGGRLGASSVNWARVSQ